MGHWGYATGCDWPRLSISPRGSHKIKLTLPIGTNRLYYIFDLHRSCLIFCIDFHRFSYGQPETFLKFSLISSTPQLENSRRKLENSLRRRVYSRDVIAKSIRNHIKLANIILPSRNSHARSEFSCHQSNTIGRCHLDRIFATFWNLRRNPRKLSENVFSIVEGLRKVSGWPGGAI